MRKKFRSHEGIFFIKSRIFCFVRLNVSFKSVLRAIFLSGPFWRLGVKCDLNST